MKRWFIFSGLLLLPVLAVVGEQKAVVAADALQAQGKFKEAAIELNAALAAPALADAFRKELAFELDRLERIRKDYPLTKDKLFARLKESVRDLTEPEFEGWVAEGRFDSREIDGERRFMGSSVSNLFFRYAELNARRLPPKDTTKHDQLSLETCRVIKAAALTEKQPYVLPKRFNAVMTVTVDADAVPDGQTIRAWLPIPRQYPFQNGFSLSKASAPIKHMDDEVSPIRAIHLEQAVAKGKATEFKIEYEYTVAGVFFDIQPGKVRPVDTNNPALKPFLAEAPHIVFTPKIRALSKQIAGGETNAAVKAKKFYDWIADNIKYSYALEYSTIRNISDYCLSNGYGDCGQEALLFMTLCRLNGIPARWQTGWNLFPNAKSIHDWCEIYLEPYGWMPVDPYKGIWAMRYAVTLTPEQKREARDFYFGGLDYYRMAANSDHNQSLTPAKNSFRSDNVDFQRGELEWGTNNIYFDQYNYELKVKEAAVQ
ncbi:MAG: transglutaminase-like domain-containing protein [Verrucomicrobiota bacterium]